MPSRVQLTKDVYMKLDGQWQIVLSGSVIDVVDPQSFHATHATVLNEQPGTLITAHGKVSPTSVRGVRTK